MISDSDTFYRLCPGRCAYPVAIESLVHFGDNNPDFRKTVIKIKYVSPSKQDLTKISNLE